MAEIEPKLKFQYTTEPGYSVSIKIISLGAYLVNYTKRESYLPSTHYFDSFDSACEFARDTMLIPDQVLRAYDAHSSKD